MRTFYYSAPVANTHTIYISHITISRITMLPTKMHKFLRQKIIFHFYITCHVLGVSHAKVTRGQQGSYTHWTLQSSCLPSLVLLTYMYPISLNSIETIHSTISYIVSMSYMVTPVRSSHSLFVPISHKTKRRR